MEGVEPILREQASSENVNWVLYARKLNLVIEVKFEVLSTVSYFLSFFIAQNNEDG